MQKKKGEKGANPQDSFIDIAKYAESIRIFNSFLAERIGDSIANSVHGQHYFMKQKAAVTFEKEETLVIRQSAYLKTDFCPTCNEVVDMLAPEVLAQIAKSTEREIFRLIESGVLPFVERKRIYACLQCYRRVVEEMNLKEPRSSIARTITD